MRRILPTAIAIAAMLYGPLCGRAEALTLATWNLEHLAEVDGAGCRPRTISDYALLRDYAEQLKADVVAVQEVENAAALRRVFDPKNWSIEISGPGPQAEKRECAGLPGQFITAQRTGFAIRKTVSYIRNPDFTALDIGSSGRHRYGVDISLDAGGAVRLMSVHLKSGCHSDPEDTARDDCKVLFEQARVLKAQWVNKRAEDGIPFAILGDFNRRLQKEPGVWSLLDEPGGGPKDLVRTVSRDAVARCRGRNDLFIDFILLSRTLLSSFEPDSFREFRYQEGGNAAPSDHCPVLVDLGIPDAAAALPAKGQMTSGLKWYRRSAELAHLTRHIYGQAAQRFDALRAQPPAGDWVVVMDADETILDNSFGQLENEHLGLGYVDERWRQWIRRSAATGVPGAMEFIRHVIESGGKIVVITNRELETETEVAQRVRDNLVALERGNGGNGSLTADRKKLCVLPRTPIDKTAALPSACQGKGYKNDKDRRRDLVVQGKADSCWAADAAAKSAWDHPLTIGFSIGDNIQDFPCMTQTDARLSPDLSRAFGKDYFLLPNPLYGSWERNAVSLPIGGAQ